MISAVFLNNRPIGIIEVKVARQLISCRFAVEATVGAALLDREKFDWHTPVVSLNGRLSQDFEVLRRHGKSDHFARIAGF
jgi:hypothetical protein